LVEKEPLYLKFNRMFDGSPIPEKHIGILWDKAIETGLFTYLLDEAIIIVGKQPLDKNQLHLTSEILRKLRELRLKYSGEKDV